LTSPKILADGIALGAAATTSHSDVEMIVFVAIMLHKVSGIPVLQSGGINY